MLQYITGEDQVKDQKELKINTVEERVIADG